MKRAIANKDVTATGVELLNMGIGIRLLPVEPDDKKPIISIVPHGVADATDDVRTWQQWLALAPDAGLGLVPGPRFAVVDDDDDTGDLDIATLGLAGTFAERTRRGRHFWAAVPSARRLRTTKLVGGHGDVITGDRHFVVMSPTPPYWPIDIEAPIRRLPADSPLWEIAAPQEAPATGWPSTITAQDRADANATLRRLQKGKFAQGINALFSDAWRKTHPNWSQSERDASLVSIGA